MLNSGTDCFRSTAPKENMPGPMATDEVLVVFGRRVKEERQKLNFTQDYLAERAGVSDDTIKRIEKGKGVKLDIAFNVADVLSIPIQMLLPEQNIDIDIDCKIQYLNQIITQLKSQKSK